MGLDAEREKPLFKQLCFESNVNDFTTYLTCVSHPIICYSGNGYKIRQTVDITQTAIIAIINE